MNAYIFKDDCELNIICPFCFYIDEYNRTIEFTDYVNRPMIWCENCKAKSFLNITISSLHLLAHYNTEKENHKCCFDIRDIDPFEEKMFNNYVKEIIVNKLPEKIYNKVKNHKYIKDKNIIWFKIELMFVTRIRNTISSSKEIDIDNLFEESCIDCNSYNIMDTQNSHTGPFICCEIKYNGNNYYYSYCED